MSEEQKNQDPFRGSIFPGIIMMIAGLFLAITTVAQADGWEGKVILKVVAGLLLSLYGVYRIKKR